MCGKYQCLAKIELKRPIYISNFVFTKVRVTNWLTWVSIGSQVTILQKLCFLS